MAKVFRDLAFNWRGKEYKIASDNVMAAIGAVEEHLTLKELMGDLQNRKTIKLVSLSKAYSALLANAGCDVSPEELYKAMFTDGTGEEQKTAALAVQALVLMMVPQSAIEEVARKVASGEIDPKKANRRMRRADAASSRKRTKSQ
jgi:aspartate/methionine/tyrosine aminotransferase